MELEGGLTLPHTFKPQRLGVAVFLCAVACTALQLLGSLPFYRSIEMALRHILRATDLDSQELRKLFWRAQELERKSAPTLVGRKVALIFYEPSTRTMLSFDSAVKELGGTTLVTAEAGKFSSAVKGETLEDSMTTVSCYADAIVLRHPENGSAERASRASFVPVINAGDGSNEHPTQAFLDLYTIWKALQNGGLEKRELRLVFFGDNAFSRTVRSLALLIAQHGSALGITIESVTFCGVPPYLEPPPEVRVALELAGITVTFWTDTVPPETDVLYVTRPQVERHQSGSTPMSLVLPNDTLERLNQRALIMHPLPRVNELPKHFDTDSRAHYFQQVRNGLFVRMALLEMILA